MTDDQWRRAEPVLTQAIGLDAADRDRLLQSAFQSESDLRGEVLKVLREFHAATVRFGLADAAAPSRPHSGNGRPNGVAGEGPSEGPFLAPGEMCGRYRIVRLLGVGGMGQVYLAEDVDLGTAVAVKLVSDQLLESPEARAQLRREAARAAQLRYHPHIATVLQFMELELKGRNVAALAMEYVGGTSASQLIADRRIGVDRAVRWAIQVARAIEFAHGKGILHCDLKPANIQIEQTPGGDHVKVLDFGIARALIDLGPSKAVAGTPAYMAPEQVIADDCGPAADIYALGVTLFELVTGRRPYHGIDTADLLVQVIGAPVPKASAVAAGVPHALDQVLQRAMAKRPGDRYESMTAFRQDLEARLAPPAQARWSVVAGCLGGFLTFVTLLGFVTSQALDQGLGRVTDFQPAALFSWFYWGVRSLIAPTVFSITLLMAFVCVAGAIRLAGASRASKALLARMIAPVRPTLAPLKSLPTSTLGQLLLLLHVVILCALALYFRPLLTGFMNFMMAARGSIDALRPSNLAMHELYGYLMTAELLVFCIAWYRLLRLRASRREREGVAYIVAGLAAIGLSMFLFTARFRILSHSESERVMYGAETCYLVQERGSSALLFCPLTYPRNVIVGTADVVRTGKIESIFSPLDPS